MRQELEKEYQIPKLTDLIDVSILQQIQDWAAKTAGVSIMIRDTEGFPVTHASMSNEFCTLISGELHTNPMCRASNVKAAELAAKAGSPQKYTCYAGLTQFAAPIQIDGHLLGTIVVGDRPAEPIDPKKVKELSDQFGVDYEKLLRAARSMKTWSDEEIKLTTDFLYSIANTLISLCYQGYSLRKKVQELTALLEISRLVISEQDLQKILDQIAVIIVRALGVKACTIRLLDREKGELILKSTYNLSSEYLNAGPFTLTEHPICLSAMEGKPVAVHDVCSDPKFPYQTAAKKEGLCSMLCVGMKSKDRPIGTIHLYTDEPHDFTDDEEKLAQSIANQAALVIHNAELYKESIEKQRMERELSLAREIQSNLLPNTEPKIEWLDIKARTVPCGHLSGDWYDFINIDDGRLYIVVADVSGKGAPGAILMSTTHATVHAAVKDALSPKDVLNRVNTYLCKYTRSTEFVTMFLAVVDPVKRLFTYANAGHNPPIIFRRSPGVFLEQGGLPLGIVETSTYVEEQIEILTDDVIILYTDGVTESLIDEGDPLGTKNLMMITQGNLNDDAQSLLNKIYDKILSRVNNKGQQDDITLVVIKVC